MLSAPCQGCPLRRSRRATARRARPGDCPACMLDHLERAAAGSGPGSAAPQRQRPAGGARTRPAAGTAAQAQALRLLERCAGELADVTAASDRVDAVLRRGAR